MKFYVSLLATVLCANSAFAGQFKNLKSVQDCLGFTKYYSQKNPGRRLRIAILDKDFSGYKKEIGVTLPANTIYIPGPTPQKPPIPPTPKAKGIEQDNHLGHGVAMAQILTAFMSNELQSPQWTPDLVLYNVYGYTNFKYAIDDMVKRKVDLVLYSEVWQYGGNNDGTGFINTEVNRATSAGIIWVNAAGNFGLTTYNSGIQTLQDDWVKLPDQNQALMIRCENNKAGKCFLRAVLAWNDFKNDSDKGTDKDLDLVLTDDVLNVLQVGGLRQSDDRNESRPGYSKYPREIIEQELKPGVYFLRVKNRSKNFASRDSLRISVEAESITMPSHSWNESILNPADNNTVITVGASDFQMSSTSTSLGKPDLLAPSKLDLVDGRIAYGSSNAAAIVAAGLGIIKSSQPKATRKDLLAKSVTQGSWNQAGITLNLLGFIPTGPGCFLEMTYPQMPAYLQDVLNKGGVIVATTIGNRVMVPFDPITLAPGLQRNLLNDMVVALPEGGYAVYPRFSWVPPGAAEVFQRPPEAGLCRPTVIISKGFHL